VTWEEIVTDIERPEGVSQHRPVARVREGGRGDWSVMVWLPTQVEAQALATRVNEHLRKLEAAETEP
jgi:hypothetical protein